MQIDANFRGTIEAKTMKEVFAARATKLRRSILVPHLPSTRSTVGWWPSMTKDLQIEQKRLPVCVVGQSSYA